MFLRRKTKYFIGIDDYVWVAYPFISGRSYHGTPEDIIAAGRLMGQIHAAPIPNTFQLYQFSWPNYDDVSIQEDINGITNRIEKQNLTNGAELITYMLLEEGLWLLTNVDEDWERSHQRQFLISLLNTNVQKFSW